MRLPAVILAALLVSASPAAAQDALTGTLHSFFGGYREPPPPVGGNCEAVSAAIGPEATWLGMFSGHRLPPSSDEYDRFTAQGCFESEIDCRIWQQRALNYAFGRVLVSSCRRGAYR